MKGQYKTKDGEIVNVVMFDEPNMIVKVECNGQSWWSPKHEYETWQSLSPEESPIEIAAAPIEEPAVEQSEEKKVEEKPKKRTYKKKEK